MCRTADGPLEVFSEYADVTKAVPVLKDQMESSKTLPVEALRTDIVDQAKRRALQQPK